MKTAPSRCQFCGSKLSRYNDSIGCTVCEREYMENLDRARRIWEYSEAKIREHAKDKDYFITRREAYNVLIYTLMHTFRLPRYDLQGRRFYIHQFAGDWRELVQVITSYPGPINSGNFLDERMAELVAGGYVTEIGVNPNNHDQPLYQLSIAVPNCSI